VRWWSAGADGPALQPSLACLCTAETPSPLTIMPLLPARQPAGGTPRRATRARARAVATVGQSAQRSADRSVQRLIPRRRWTAPADRWAARRLLLAPRRRGNALERPLLPATPQPPLGGSADRLPLLEVSGSATPATGPLRSFLPPCKRLECNAAGLLRQGLALRRIPAGRLSWSDRERGQDGVPGGLRYWRTSGRMHGACRGQAAHACAERGAGVG
jgi:hypothetical protein